MIHHNIHDLLSSPAKFEHVRHGLQPTSEHYDFTLSSSAESSNDTEPPVVRLRQTGVHLCRLAAHTQSVPVHAHTHEEEWILVLSGAGRGDNSTGARALIRAEMSGETKTRPLSDGDYLAFPAGLQDARALRAGDAELVYLVSGTRSHEVCVYPEIGKVRFRDMNAAYVVDEEHVNWMDKKNASSA